MIATAFIDVVRNREFRHLWFGQIISQIGLNMLSFVLAIQVYRATGSNTAVSVMLLSFGLPAIFFGIVAGGIVDYFDKRSILLFCNVTRIFILLFFFLFFNNLFMLYVLAVVISIVTQLFIPAEAPSIPQLVKQDKLLTANSLFTISFYLSTVLGFILAGPAIKLFGHQNVYLVMAFFMSLASFFTYQLPRLKSSLQNQGRLTLTSFFPMIKSLVDGVAFIKNNERIRNSLYLMTFSQALIATLAVLAPGFADRVLSIELTDASFLVMGPAAIGLVAGAFFIGWFGHKYLKGSIILNGIIAVGINLLLLSLMTKAHKPSLSLYLFDTQFTASYLWMAMILLFTLGVFNSLISVPANTILQEDSDNDLRGRVYGVLTSLTGGVSLLPVVFSGILADNFGVGRTLAVLGGVVFTSGFYLYLQRKTKLNKIT